jgi:hypothetical protein
MAVMLADAWFDAWTVLCVQVQHLEHWGINMMSMQKTEKTMAELQIDLNMSFEFDKITESGAALEPLSGPGCASAHCIPCPRSKYTYVLHVSNHDAWRIACGIEFWMPFSVSVSQKYQGEVLNALLKHWYKII